MNERVKITLLQRGKPKTYVQPLKCPLPKEYWEDSLCYCWGLAIAVDKKKRRSFIKNNCNKGCEAGQML